MDYHPKKHFGQHFLNHPRYLGKILTALNPQRTDLLVEVGAGMGALTRKVLPEVDHLHVVEIDTRFIEYLSSHFDLEKLTIHPANALKFDFAELISPKQDHKLRIFGNLPYNISTPLLFHFLKFKSQLQDMLFLLQKEVVDRMVAHPGNKTYGRLSVMVQYHCEAVSLFDVPAKAFTPPPKVESSVVHLTPYERPPESTALDYAVFEQIVNEAFQHRRKTIRNALKPWIDETKLQEINLDPQQRPETLSVEDFVRISRHCSSGNEERR